MKRYIKETIKETKRVIVISADIKRCHVIVKVYSSLSSYAASYDGYVLSGRELEEVLEHDTDRDVIHYLCYEGIFQSRTKVFKPSRPIYFYKNGAPTPAWYDL